MTVDELQARLVELDKEREILLARLNGVAGAIHENRYWLDKLSQTEKGAGETPPL